MALKIAAVSSSTFKVGEITITRRLFAWRKLEYLLNGKLAARDIQDILLVTWPRPESHAIIEQGRIG